MAVPYTFGSILGGASIPLSELDDNFSYLTTSPTFTGNITVNGSVDSFGVTSYFGGSSPLAYTGVVVRNTASNGYASTGWWIGNSGANGVASVNYAPGILLKFGVLANDTTTPIVFVNNNDQERMRIDASGNVGIGTSSPSSKLNLYGGTLRITQDNTVLLDQFTTTSNAYSGTNSNHPYNIRTNNVDRVVVDTSGNVGIGTSSPASRVNIKGNNEALRIDADFGLIRGYGADSTTSVGFIQFNKSYDVIISAEQSIPIVFRTNAIERARIDSSGNLLVGTTDNSQTSGPGVKIKNSGGTSGVVSCVATQTDSSADTYHVYSTGAGAYRFYVELSGTIRATSTSIVAISDISLKENIRDLETGLDEILRLKPRRFDWREETKLGVKDVAGFIAQEVEPVLPDLVSDGKYTDEKNKKFVKMGDMIPTMVKAIQELAAKVTELEEKLNAK